jgi:6-pyruvoyltetrahydropterin/6-carboxytetrahydropterin synthase
MAGPPGTGGWSARAMTYEVSVEGRFAARHWLRLPDGTLEPPHEHDWHVAVTFAGENLDSAGMLVDFELAKTRLATVLDRLSSGDLNASPLLDGLNPSAEIVARIIYDLLVQDRLPGVRLWQVAVTEAPGCRATYRRS